MLAVRGRKTTLAYQTIFCGSVVLGCMAKLESVLDFSDALVFAMALANVFGLYALAPLEAGARLVLVAAAERGNRPVAHPKRPRRRLRPVAPR